MPIMYRIDAKGLVLMPSVSGGTDMIETTSSKVAIAALAILLLGSPACADEWQLTTGSNWNDDPEWCGDSIVFHSDRDPSIDFDIWKVEIDSTGHGVDEIFCCKRDASHVDSSPTWEHGSGGTFVFFERQIPGGVTQICGMTTSGSAVITATDGDHADHAPDRSSGHMLVHSDRNGNDDIVWIDHGGEPHGSGSLTADPAADRYPFWSPDEQWVAFASDRSGNWDIWVMSADGESDSLNLRQVTDTPENETRPAWSPTGEYIAFAREGTGIVAADAWGRGEYAVTSGPDDSSPTWSDDASMLAFSRPSGGNCHIWVTDQLPESPVEKTSWGRLKAMYR
ncbi:MAG: hypothetical protein GF400_04210 [Candidatus Eisenbacteria bacterium]|nr:hypothetical protein [Candidatus Eisenbacteria bacterium]